MKEFDFQFHGHPVTKYPENSPRVQFGNGYTFTAAPDAPVTRTFVLSFPTMLWHTNNAGLVDYEVDPKKNMGRLVQFYEEHQTHAKFTYRHPAYGLMVCRFNKPLETPKVKPGGFGATEGFEIELVEVHD
tara:strand:+ start:41 stop:430 length:390 start_codon:yes stop_codon:yes gene_type:complete